MPIQRWKGAALIVTVSVLVIGGGAIVFRLRPGVQVEPRTTSLTADAS